MRPAPRPFHVPGARVWNGWNRGTTQRSAFQGARGWNGGTTEGSARVTGRDPSARGRGVASGGRNDVDDLVAAALERAEECRKHGGGLLLGVVEQHNPATIGL